MNFIKSFILHLKNDQITGEICNENSSILNTLCDGLINEDTISDIEGNSKETLDSQIVTNNGNQTTECDIPKSLDSGLTLNYSETTEAINNSFEADYFDNIINSSQMTSDGSLNNLELDNFTNDPDEIATTQIECPESQIKEPTDSKDSKDEIINLDDFQRFMYEEIEKSDMLDMIDKFPFENVCRTNKPQDEKNDGQKTDYFIEIEGNLVNGKNLNSTNVDDVINISSDDNLSLLSDLEIISISSQEGNCNDNAINKLHNNNTSEESFQDSKLSNCTKTEEDKTNDTLPEEIINEAPNGNKIAQSNDESSSDSYHSSYFEFISEEEAKKKLRTNNMNFNGTYKTIEITQDSGFNDSGCSSQNSGPSCSTNIRNSRDLNNYREAIARYENYNFNLQNVTDRSYRQNHAVPDGDGYLNLFHGVFESQVPYMIENKSTRASSMYVQYEGFGFDMRAAGKATDSDDEYADEAKENAKKILNMYPAENRRKRRRF